MKGDLIADMVESKYDLIGHGVNCAGVMGAGFAKIVADRWPHVREAYRGYCNQWKPTPGNAQIVAVDGQYPHYFANLFTQDAPGPNARLEWVEASLKTLEMLLNTTYPDLQRIAFPALGSGIGGLEFGDVQKIVVKVFGCSDLYVKLYRPMR